MSTELFVPAFANPAGSPIRELFPYLGKAGLISLAGGYPSPTLLDVEGLREATSRALAHGASVLQYGATEGSTQLKEQLLHLSAARGIEAPADQLLVTSGSQQGFDLLVRIFVKPGDVVLMECPTYPAAIQALRLAGAQILEVPMDGDGLQTQTLAALLESLPQNGKPKLLYTVPTFSNPHGTSMPQARRRELVALAITYGFVVIEDDPYGELAFTDERPEPLYVHGERLAGGRNPVVYLSSLSKTVAPALRIGWMIGSVAVVRRCAIAKQTADMCTSPISQLVAAEYLEGGRYGDMVRAACAEYRLRAEALTSGLRDALSGDLRFDAPKGGLFLWAESAVKLDPKVFFDAAVANGVLFVPGTAFLPTAQPRIDSLRLSFAAPTVDQVREGVLRLARAFRTAAEAATNQPSITL